MTSVGAFLLVTGAALSVLAAIGILDFPSPIARMHAATKSASLGLSLLAIGAGFISASFFMIAIGMLVAVFLFVTAPISGHMIGRAAYNAGQQSNLVLDELSGVEPTPLAVPPTAADRFSWGRWATMTIVWVILWRDASPGTLLAGATVAAIVEGMRRTADHPLTVDPVGAARLSAFYLGQVIVANARVAWEVITPRNEAIREAIVACPLQTQSTRAALLVANAISFAPGSLTVELTEEPLTLYVHVLHYTSTEDVREDVRRLEERVMRALPDNPRPAARGSKKSQ